MANLYLPPQETKKWTQPNLGDLMGILWATFNIDLISNKGKVRLSKRTRVILGNDDDADFTYPTAALRSNADTTDRWWILCHAALFKSTSDSPLIGLTQDAIANTPTDVDHYYSDMVEHEGAIVVSTSANLHRLVTGTWTRGWWITTLGQATLTVTIPHPLHVYNRLLLIGDANKLHVIDRNSLVTNARITLPSYYQIRCIRHTPGKVWIGVKNIYDGLAAVVEWDGYSDTYNYIHEIEGIVTLAIGIKSGVPYAVSDAGILFYYNGSTFVPLDYFPVFSEDVYQLGPSSRYSARWIDNDTSTPVVHWNGMENIDNKMHILLSGNVYGVTKYILDNMKSGIWCYDPDIGLHHKFSLSKNKSSDTIKDYGSQVILNPGFLIKLPKASEVFMAGATIPKDNSSSLHAVFVKDNSEGVDYQKRGYFITTKIQTANILDQWEKIWLKFKKFRDAYTAIVVKIKEADDEDYNFPFRAVITWTNNTTFTSTETNFANAVVGDEIEVMLGDGAGATVHISTITLVATTYTVVLDEVIGNVTGSGTAMVRVTKWRKVKSFTTLSITNDYEALAGNSNWVQFKVELRGKKDDPEIDEIIIVTKDNIKPGN